MFKRTSENVAMNNSPIPAQVAVRGWINSEGHKKNMEGDYDLTGVGIARSRNGSWYFTQIFVSTYQYNIFRYSLILYSQCPFQFLHFYLNPNNLFSFETILTLHQDHYIFVPLNLQVCDRLWCISSTVCNSLFFIHCLSKVILWPLNSSPSSKKPVGLT